MPRTEVVTVEYHRHAVERYGERVRPGCSSSTTLSQLRAVVACAGEIAVEPPAWAPWDSRSSAYLLLGEDIIFPLRMRADGAYVAITCLTRGSLPPSVRAARNARRQRRKSKRRRS